MNLFIILNLVSFIRTLFIVVIIYYGVRFLIRYFFPMLIDKGIKNMQQKMQDQQRQNQRSARQPGDVTIEYNNKSGKASYQSKGEYVDFEEVE